MAAVALTAALTIGPMPLFHTDVELADWQSQWTGRMLEGETPSLIADFLDMSERHPCRLVKCPEVRVASRVVREATPPPNIGGGVEQWRALVALYFPADLVELALKVMSCESGGSPSAHNPSGASGLFQHMPQYWAERSSAAGWAGADIYDPAANVAVAAWLATSDGWHHWNPSKRCWG